MAASGWFLALRLLALGLVLCKPQRQTHVIYGAVNGSVTFPGTTPASFKEILWRTGGDKVIEWIADMLPETRSYRQFIDRTSLDTKCGNLTISNLTHSDEGEYELELESSDIKENIKFHLEVIDPLPSMTLICTWTDDTITIQCGLMEPYLTHADLLRYSWLCSGAPCPKDTQSSEMSFEKNPFPEEITCVVRNPLSEQKSSISSATCVPDRSRNRWALLPAVMVVSLLAAIGGYICLNSAPSVSAASVAGTEGNS